MSNPFSVIRVALVIALLLFASAGAQQWIVDGVKFTPPDTSGTNTVYCSTNAVARWIALTNGIALDVYSPTGWVRQVEFSEN